MMAQRSPAAMLSDAALVVNNLRKTDTQGDDATDPR
jgi:hypothetical protein